MSLDELTTLSDSFEEDELSALNALPRDQVGLKQLLDHLESFDSLQAWCLLFEEFFHLLTEDQYRDLMNQAQSVLSNDGLTNLLPHMFPPPEYGTDEEIGA